MKQFLNIVAGAYNRLMRASHGVLAWVVLAVGLLGAFGLMYAGIVLGEQRHAVMGWLWTASMCLFLLAFLVLVAAGALFGRERLLTENRAARR